MRKSMMLLLSLLLLGQTTVASADAYTEFAFRPTAESAFAYLYQVASHPRCANCHGVVAESGHIPTVGDQRVAHPMNISSRNNIVLKPTDHGFEQTPVAGMTCRNCHRDSNGRERGMPPGAANQEMPGFVWHMPPPTMAIPADLSAAELCQRWLNPARNSSHLAQRGGREDLKTFRAEFLDHHANVDPLVHWAWQPGLGRTPAPGSHTEFVRAMDLWISADAPCPK